MEPYDFMGDQRHKKYPPRGATELNTQTFRDEARAVLEHNKLLNGLGGRRKGDHGYLISTHADIAEHFKMKNQRMIDRILGPVRSDSKVKLVDCSDLIKPIRELLGLRMIEITVPADRADALRKIAALPEKEFAPYRDSIHDKSEQH
jgi:hypothetical protein